MSKYLTLILENKFMRKIDRKVDPTSYPYFNDTNRERLAGIIFDDSLTRVEAELSLLLESEMDKKVLQDFMNLLLTDCLSRKIIEHHVPNFRAIQTFLTKNELDINTTLDVCAKGNTTLMEAVLTRVIEGMKAGKVMEAGRGGVGIYRAAAARPDAEPAHVVRHPFHLD